MANATVNWSPASSVNTVSQDVQYKKSTSSTWITFANVGANIDSTVITGLENNVIYNFRVTANCTYGGPSPSLTFTGVVLTCPTITITPTVDSATISFSDIGESITSFTIDLLNSAGTDILYTEVYPYTTSQPITDVYSELTPSTAYKIRLTVTAGSSTKTCPVQDFSTLTAVCNAPTDVSATITE